MSRKKHTEEFCRSLISTKYGGEYLEIYTPEIKNKPRYKKYENPNS